MNFDPGLFVIESVCVTLFGMLASTAFLVASLAPNYAAAQSGTVSPPGICLDSQVKCDSTKG